MTIEDRVRRVLTEAVADEPPAGAPPSRSPSGAGGAGRSWSARPPSLLVLAAVVSLVAVRRPERAWPGHAG